MTRYQDLNLDEMSYVASKIGLPPPFCCSRFVDTVEYQFNAAPIPALSIHLYLAVFGYGGVKIRVAT